MKKINITDILNHYSSYEAYTKEKRQNETPAKNEKTSIMRSKLQRELKKAQGKAPIATLDAFTVAQEAYKLITKITVCLSKEALNGCQMTIWGHGSETYKGYATNVEIENITGEWYVYCISRNYFDNNKNTFYPSEKAENEMLKKG